MKAACRFCHEINDFDDPKPAKEPCRCGVTPSVLELRAMVLAAVSVVLILTGGCWLNLHYTTQQVKAVSGGYKIVPVPSDAPPFEHKSKGKYQVEPKKDDEK